MKRTEQLRRLLIRNSYRLHNLMAEADRLEQIDYWLDELQELLQEQDRTCVIDWVFGEKVAE